MDKNSQLKEKSGKHSPETTGLEKCVDPVNEDIAGVLEHVSSSFRWELLEAPAISSISPESKKPNNQKLYE